MLLQADLAPTLCLLAYGRGARKTENFFEKESCPEFSWIKQGRISFHQCNLKYSIPHPQWTNQNHCLPLLPLYFPVLSRTKSCSSTKKTAILNFSVLTMRPRFLRSDQSRTVPKITQSYNSNRINGSHDVCRAQCGGWVLLAHFLLISTYGYI